ncbi:MAG: type I methionyl aminopeptidase [Bacteroidales bacterium]|nr:type I methionyl aminopeptidase [Bacteroidales bacterium]
MIHYKNQEQIELLRESSLLVGKTHAEVVKAIKPGITTKELDSLAEMFIRDHGAQPAFKGYQGFPATLCLSVNEQVVHGIPGDRELKEDDLISVDCGVLMNGYYGDSAYTYALKNVPEDTQKLMIATKESLYIGIEQALDGKRIGDIGNAIQTHVEAQGFSVVRDLVGHGLGKNLHEEPEIFHYGKPGRGIALHEGLVICIEPMINQGKRFVIQERDGWTIRTADRKPSAHFEHAIAVRKNQQADILSSFEFIEEAIKDNEHLINI